MIALLDYGAGNLTSVRKGLAAAGAASICTPRHPDELDGARGIVIPGVGHFAATEAIGRAWREAIGARIAAGVPVLGICVGLQWLFAGSEEAPDVGGLGVFPGLCTRLRSEAPSSFAGRGSEEALGVLKIPHVGWNSLRMTRASGLMAGVPDQAQVYFTHSYAAPLVGETVAICRHGTAFSAAVERGRVAAVQFHPEKSGEVGLRVLRNWLDAL